MGYVLRLFSLNLTIHAHHHHVFFVCLWLLVQDTELASEPSSVAFLSLKPLGIATASNANHNSLDHTDAAIPSGSPTSAFLWAIADKIDAVCSSWSAWGTERKTLRCTSLSSGSFGSSCSNYPSSSPL